MDADAAGGAEDEELSDSLRLEPDIELEPGVDLKADLGLATGEEEGAAAEAAAETTVAQSLELENIEVAPPPVTVAAGTTVVENSVTSIRADDLGFEMIEKAEAAGAATAVSSGSGGGGGNGPPVEETGKAARKGWPWAWGRN